MAFHGSLPDNPIALFFIGFIIYPLMFGSIICEKIGKFFDRNENKRNNKANDDK